MTSPRVSHQPRYYYFEVVECFRKLALTGMMVFFFPESASQIVVGLFLSFSSSIAYSSLRPFVEPDDNFLSEIAQCQIFFVLLSALLSMISSPQYVDADAEAGDLYSELLFGWLMVLVSLLGPAIAVAMLAYELKEHCKAPDGDEPSPDTERAGGEPAAVDAVTDHDAQALAQVQDQIACGEYCEC